MEKFKRKECNIKAVQWTGWNLMEVLTFADLKLDSPTNELEFDKFNELQQQYRHNGLPLFNDEYSMVEGDWLVLEDGTYDVYTNKNFNDTFVNLNEDVKSINECVNCDGYLTEGKLFNGVNICVYCALRLVEEYLQ